MWVPLASQPFLGWPPGAANALQSRGTGWLTLLGRLKPGLTRYQALESLTPLARDLQRQDPLVEQRRGIALESATGMPPLMRGAAFALACLLQALGVLFLLIPCANLACLLMSRSSARRAEITIRCSLGASRWRIARQLLTERVVIALCGGGGGLFLTLWLTQGLAHLRLPFSVPIHIELQPDARVLGFTLLIAFATVVLFGMGPALRLSRISLVPIAGHLMGTEMRRQSWRRHLLVIWQISISLVFLIAAGLCVRSFQNAHLIDPGFKTRNVLEFVVSPGLNGYPGTRSAVFYADLLRRLRSTPGVQAASLAALAPLSYGEMLESVPPRGIR